MQACWGHIYTHAVNAQNAVLNTSVYTSDISVQVYFLCMHVVRNDHSY